MIEVKIKDETLRYIIDTCTSDDRTLNQHKVAVYNLLKELQQYRATGLAPDQVDQMSEEISYLRDSYNDMTERYNEMLYDM